MIPYAVCLLIGCVVGYLVFYFTSHKKEKVEPKSFDTRANTGYNYPHDMTTTLHRRGAHILTGYDQWRQYQSPQQQDQSYFTPHVQQHPSLGNPSALPRPYLASTQGDNGKSEVPQGDQSITNEGLHSQQPHQHQNQHQHQHQAYEKKQGRNTAQSQLVEHPSLFESNEPNSHTGRVPAVSPIATSPIRPTTRVPPPISLHTLYPPPPLPPPPLQSTKSTSPQQQIKCHVSPRRRRSAGAVPGFFPATAEEPHSRIDTPELYQNSTTTPSRSRSNSFSRTSSSVSSISTSSYDQSLHQRDAVVNAYHPATADKHPSGMHLHPDLPLPAQVMQPPPHQEPVVNRSFPDTKFVSLNMKDIELISVIGGGAFGQVWKGVWQGTPVAVKVLSSACQTEVPPPVLQAFQDEVQMLARLRHPNICLFLGACLEPPCRTIVTEIVSRGSLWDALRTPHLFEERGRGDIFHWPWWTIRRVLDGTCRGLIYLHGNQPPIIHRDLKSANLLLDDSFNVKICDFGLARLRDFTSTMTANVGTAQWTAPEVLAGKEYNESADMYSLGIVAWELLTGKCPYDHTNNQVEIAVNVAHHKVRPIIPERCPNQVKDFIVKCWAEQPQARMSALEALKQLETVIPVI